MKLQRHREDYLKTILYLERKKGYVRSMDVAEHMNVTKPSVCNAVRRLQESGLLSMDREKLLHLTPAGRATAEHIQERYDQYISGDYDGIIIRDSSGWASSSERPRPIWPRRSAI